MRAYASPSRTASHKRLRSASEGCMHSDSFRLTLNTAATNLTTIEQCLYGCRDMLWPQMAP